MCSSCSQQPCWRLPPLRCCTPALWWIAYWDIKRSEYEQMLLYRNIAGAGFLLLGLVMASAAYGWFKARRWAWWLVQGIFEASLIGDLARLFKGDVAEGLFGIVVVSLLLVYIRSKGVRAVFLARLQPS